MTLQHLYPSIVSFLILAVCGCQPAPLSTSRPVFAGDDFIRCSTGGGDGLHDELVLTAAGELTYRTLDGRLIRKSLTPVQARALYEELLENGLLRLTEVPNRQIERYGVVLEAELGERAVRGSVGLLEMSRDKHRNWQNILAILTRHIDLGGQNSEP